MNQNTEHHNNVLILTGDPLGSKMAGPGIRALNFAIQLSSTNNVVLATTNLCQLSNEHFDLKSLKNHQDFEELEQWADVIIIQGNMILEFPQIKKTKKFLVCDLYDPMQLEQLEQGRDKDLNLWNQRISHANHILALQVAVGDFFLAASERQRDFWIGYLALAGRVNAKNYSEDNTLAKLISVVPFGLTEQKPIKHYEAIKGVVKGIDKDDKVILWAGGVYNWFDPVTLVKAMGVLKTTYPKYKLFFLGTQHPHPGVPEMEILNTTFKSAKKLGLLGVNVFFNSDWVNYSERENYLLSSDIGVSTHFEHLETRYSFRTRILDYLWARLPIISTAGDHFAELIAIEELGVVVPEQDEVALSEAIIKLGENKSFRNKVIQNLEKTAQRYTWESASRPLIDYCSNPYFASDKMIKYKDGTIHRAKNPPVSGPFLLVRRKLYNLTYRYKRDGFSGIFKFAVIKFKFLAK